MSIRVSALPLATRVSPADQVIIEQGNPPVTRRVPLFLIQPISLYMNNQGGLSYTLVLQDSINTMVILSNAAATVLNVPNNAAVPMPVGSQIILMRGGIGTMAVTPQAPATILTANSLNLRAQNSRAILIQTAIDVWSLAGDT